MNDTDRRYSLLMSRDLFRKWVAKLVKDQLRRNASVNGLADAVFLETLHNALLYALSA